MGYLLPTQPIQSGLYAGRMTMDPYDYANVQRVRPVKMKSLFEEELEERLYEMKEIDQPLRRQTDAHKPKDDQIQQTAALSKELSVFVGKGLQINTYV